ncbi:Release factor glutamine methyltransferase [compost metagenome]
MLAVRERCRRIPLAHIVGSVAFDELPLAVGTGVFIPRSHSRIIHKWLAEGHIARYAHVLDLCAGTGAIGLAIAKRRPDLQVTCVEYDDIAYQYLLRNVQRLADEGLSVSVLRADVRERSAFAPFEGEVALIVANPPYVPEHMALLPEWGDHHPKTSVFSGKDGLELTRSIVEQAITLLRPDGWLLVEHGEEQSQAIRALFAQAGMHEVETRVDDQETDATGSAVMTIGCKRL